MNRIAVTTILSLALLGPAHAARWDLTVEITKKVLACSRPLTIAGGPESWLEEEARVNKVNAHLKPWDQPLGHPHDCRWFEPQVLDVVMTTPADNPGICLTDHRDDPLDPPCYWVRKTILKAPL